MKSAVKTRTLKTIVKSITTKSGDEYNALRCKEDQTRNAIADEDDVIGKPNEEATEYVDSA